jgi:hypothetical protein
MVYLSSSFDFIFLPCLTLSKALQQRKNRPIGEAKKDGEKQNWKKFYNEILYYK